jgi:hypothetical protein
VFPGRQLGVRDHDLVAETLREAADRGRVEVTGVHACFAAHRRGRDRRDQDVVRRGDCAAESLDPLGPQSTRQRLAAPQALAEGLHAAIPDQDRRLRRPRRRISNELDQHGV